MAFGIQVRTSSGMTDVADLFGVRMIAIVKVTSVSGSVSVPEWDSPEGAYIVVNNSNRTRMPWVKWDNATKLLEWGKQVPAFNNDAYSNDFTVYCME